MVKKKTVKKNVCCDPKDAKSLPWLLFIGCMFVGLGTGMLYHQTAVGLLIGLGVGFIAAFIAGVLLRK